MSKQLLFVSPRFLFPVDSGGKIRTTQILRGMKGGSFQTTLASPAPPNAAQQFASELAQVCDRFVSWPARQGARWRAPYLASSLPIPVATDQSSAGRRLIAAEIGRRPDVAVFDFPHADVLAAKAPGVARVMFTHNVEAEIFRRHAEVASNPVLRWVWRNQHHKMQAFERRVVHDYDAVIAVSERDAQAFAREYSLTRCPVIDTGVDLEYFSFSEPPAGSNVVFSGSMDWLANADGIRHLLEDIWPLVVAEEPNARMTVVGRAAPPDLVERARRSGYQWEFTGFVPDVREYLRQASVYVIPLRVGGGTRLKVFEAMANGCPVVSTSIGVEGLHLEAGQHYVRAEQPEEFARATVRLLRDHAAAVRMARAARSYIEERYSFRQVARQFESICLDAVAQLRNPGLTPSELRRSGSQCATS